MDYSKGTDTELQMKVGQLEIIGISSQAVMRDYRTQTGKMLNLNDMIKVSSKDEGKYIKFETLDEVSFTVPVFSADGSFNKIE